MPLKHDTETRMILVLTLLVAVTGAVCAFLPPVSVSILPWAVFFVLSLVYPMMLYPMMKERRADYEFRALHFVPALMLLLWLAIDLMVAFRPDWEKLQLIYTWGWAGVMVIGACILIALFTLHVIRQRVQRLAIIAGVLIPFLILSQLSDRQSWDRKLAMTLWDGSIFSGTGFIAAGGSSSNLDPSSNAAEEQWRAQLRQMERRRQEIAQGGSSSIASSVPADSSESSTIVAVVTSQSSSRAMAGSSSSVPPHLPSSGFGPEGIALIMAAGCCAAIQRKTIRRVKVISI